MTEQALIDDFVAESAELLEGLDHELAEALAAGDSAPLHRIFRAVHTVKGAAGFLGLLNVKNYSHKVEDVLDRLRSGQLPLTPRLKTELVACIDLIAKQVERSAVAPPTAELLPPESESLQRLAEAAENVADDSVDETSTLAEVALRLESFDADNPGDWLEEMRRLVAPWAKAAAPSTPPSDGDWLTRARGSRVVVSGQDLSALAAPCLDFFEAARPAPPDDDVVQKFLAAAKAFSDNLQSLGAGESAELVRHSAEECQFIHESPIDLDALLLSTIEEKIQASLAPYLREAPKAPPAKAVDAAPSEKPAEEAGGRPGKSGTVRVREETLDQFVWHVGETFLAMETYRDLHSRLTDSKADSSLLAEFNEMNREMTVTVGKLQQAVMAVRRVPAGSLLNRIPSMVRQLAQQLGKQVEVVIEGAEILIDKSLLQELEGPMTHIVRNAMDHGFQSPADRERLGLSPTGVLRLRCRPEREFVLIEVIDDGRGVDRDRVLKLAVERGVITPSQAAAVPREEIPMLLCRPGFSTAEKISDVSGRGVGLDVVLNTVERNRGKLTIESELGRGTTFTMAFPLRSTVLMVDGLICESQNSYAAFSVDHVREVVRLTPQMLHSVGGVPTALVRGRTHPVVALRSILGRNGSPSAPCEHGVLLEHQHRSVLVAVENLNGYRKMVLKDFNRDMVRCDFLAGVAQLGGSRMALVLDVPELLRSFERPL